MAYKIGIVVKDGYKVQTYCPGEYASEEQVKAEILFRNRRFPLAPRLERVVIAQED